VNANVSDSDDESSDPVLPTYSVLARFCETAASGDEAIRGLVTRLSGHQEPFHEVVVERQESDTQWMVVARFVVVSIDGQTAVGGVSETLSAAGLEPDEVWLDRQVA
jgi:hypothetical protein